MNINELLKAQYRLLFHEDQGFTEFRVLNTKTKEIEQDFFVYGEKEFIEKAEKLIEEQKPDTALFVGINPRKNTGKALLTNIVSSGILMVDIDPERPINTPSTDEQHKEAIALGATISLSLPNSILVDSGSGAHVYLPIEPIPVVDAKGLTEQLKEWSDEIKAKYSNKKFKLDSVYDLPRVTRLWGSFNHKSKRQVTPILTEIPAVFPRIQFSYSEDHKHKPKEVLQAASVTTNERFNQLVKINAGLQMIMRGEHSFDSRSEADYAFVTILTKAHFTPQEIKELIKLSPRMETNKTDEHVETDIDRIIDKCRNNGIGSVSLIHGSEKYFRSLDERKPGLMSGFQSLDNLLGGFQKGKMYVCAARTNEGKTSLSVQLGYEFAKQGKTVLYFPTELGYEPLLDKIVSQRTGINLKRFQFSQFNDEENKTISNIKQELSTLPFIVHEDFALTSDGIEQTIKTVAPDVIVIDFIQAMKYAEGGTAKEIAENVRKIKEITNTYNVITILNSQLSRSAIGNEINLSQLKGSGAIEEFADVVMALSTISRLDYPRPVDLHVLKSRYSEIGKVRLDFYSSIGKFQEVTNA